MNESLEMLFKANNGILSTAQLKAEKLYHENIVRMMKNGEIERIRRGFYQYVSDREFSDIPTITRLFPDAVICLESALDHYGYTDRTPSSWHLAVPYSSARLRFRIDYPMIKPHFIREDKYYVGITNTVIDDIEVLIYDRERTICDLLLHKNKIDSEVFRTAIQRYVNDPRKSEAHLIEYAKKLRVERKAREMVITWL